MLPRARGAASVRAAGHCSAWQAGRVTSPEPKDTLVTYLQRVREAMLWKLDGLSEYDVRRPLTPTGTNLLGLVKHLAGVELRYFGDTFGRPSPVDLTWFAEQNGDMWVTASETRADIVGVYRTAWSHAAVTLEQCELDSLGRVPHWPVERAEVTLHQILVHVSTETYRHAGHADILRETLDGRSGRFASDPSVDAGFDWPAYVARVEAAALEVGR